MAYVKSVVQCFLVAATVSQVASSFAAEQSFNFKDPKGVNAIALTLETTLEAFHGLVIERAPSYIVVQIRLFGELVYRVHFPA